MNLWTIWISVKLPSAYVFNIGNSNIKCDTTVYYLYLSFYLVETMGHGCGVSTLHVARNHKKQFTEFLLQSE